MQKLRNALNQILNVLTGVSFLVMVAITTWQVVARYILGSPSTWSEELVSYMFAWASLFGACLVTGERGHMNIPILVEKLPEKGQKIMAVLGELIALAFSIIILLIGGTQITKLAMGQLTSSLGVVVGVFYFALPVSGVLNSVYCILNIVDIFKNGLPAQGQEETEV